MTSYFQLQNKKFSADENTWEFLLWTYFYALE